MVCLIALSVNAQQYVDLGLSSGTKWKSVNEKGFYTYDRAKRNFGSRLPTREQWMELRNECDWIWKGMGFKVIGPNGKSITLPAAGYRCCNGDDVDLVGDNGFYWSSTPDGSENACFLYSCPDEVRLMNSIRCFGLSVRLVLN